MFTIKKSIFAVMHSDCKKLSNNINITIAHKDLFSQNMILFKYMGFDVAIKRVLNEKSRSKLLELHSLQFEIGYSSKFCSVLLKHFSNLLLKIHCSYYRSFWLISPFSEPNFLFQFTGVSLFGGCTLNQTISEIKMLLCVN